MYHQNVYQISEENVIFFARKSQKRPFLCLKKPSVWWYAGDTFLYGTQLTLVNRSGAGQGYQIQATRWRELSLLCWSTVVHFQYEYFHYRSVSPKWCKIDNDEGTFLLVYRMYHQCDTKLFTSTVHYCSLLKCITKEKKLAKLWNFVSSWNCGCEPKTFGTSTAWLFTITYHHVIQYLLWAR